MSDISNSIPGEAASAGKILCLAEEYRKAALVLLQMGRRGEPLSRAPFHLSAIHAIELYLSALLVHAGHKPATIRGMQHDLSVRAQLAVASGLKLRKRTAAHLSAMTGNREYVVTRYAPETTATVSQVNRLTATLDEVASKVSATMRMKSG